MKQEGVRVKRDAMLKQGAMVQLYTPEEKRMPAIEVLFQNEDVIIVRKPAGISCEADAKGGKTICECVHDAQLANEPNTEMPLLCHRLDNQTEGILLLAKNEEIQAILMETFASRRIHKTYTCLVKGCPKPDHAILKDYLRKDEQTAHVKVYREPRKDTLTIITEYQVIDGGDISRLKITLHTGRTHQIRAHMAHYGHPLLGDDHYGDYDLNKAHKARKLMLCATGLRFSLEGKLAYLNDQRFDIKPSF